MVLDGLRYSVEYIIGWKESEWNGFYLEIYRLLGKNCEIECKI